MITLTLTTTNDTGHHVLVPDDTLFTYTGTGKAFKCTDTGNNARKNIARLCRR